MNYLIVDLSYYTFYRQFATRNWYRHANPDEKFETNYNWSENTQFWAKYKKLYLESLLKIIKKLKIDKTILARDCPRSDIWRMSFYSEYKGTRVNDPVGVGNIFKNTYSEIIPEIQTKLGDKLSILKIPNLEADDIISLLTTKIMDSDSENKITVISSDHDLLQIIRPGVTLMDAKMKPYNDKSLGCQNKDIMIKCILGDPSDNIPPAFPNKKVGKVTAQKILNSSDMLLQLISDRDNFDRLALNYLLINFANIPDMYRNYFNQLVRI